MSPATIELTSQAFVMAEPLLTLDEIVALLDDWPTEAQCATQESDGGVLYWSAPYSVVHAARIRAGMDDMVSVLGIASQVHCAYLNIADPEIAADRESSVSINPQLLSNLPPL